MAYIPPDSHNISFNFETVYTPPVNPNINLDFAGKVFRISGTVKVNGELAVKSVCIYNRSTGALVRSVQSDTPSVGYFEANVSSVEHYVIVFNDDYNSLIYDHITGIEVI